MCATPRNSRRAAKLLAPCITRAACWNSEQTPSSPYYDKKFERDKNNHRLLHFGGRSALAGKVLKEMSYSQVFNMGAFKDWANSGGPIEKPIDMGIS
jgi:hypothetical protein